MNKNLELDKKFINNAKSIICLVLALLILVNLGRIGYISIVKGDDYRKEAQETQLYDVPIDAIRGTIYDANMTPLVSSVSTWTLCANPSQINNAKFINDEVENENEVKSFMTYITDNISEILGIEKDDFIDKITGENQEKQYKQIEKKIQLETKIKLDNFLYKSYEFKDASQSGSRSDIEPSAFFWYENDSLRTYPANNFASTLLGVVNNAGNGITGIEEKYNDVLFGEKGRMVTAKDSKGNPFEVGYENVYEATPGNSLVLTIDSYIQTSLENALVKKYEETDAKGTYGIVMDVDTGKILAISNKPDFDSNDPRSLTDAEISEVDDEISKLVASGKLEKDSDEYNSQYNELISQKLNENWNNYCITSTYEPGSTFKIFTASAAIQEGLVDLNTTYTCDGAYEVAKGTTIHCSKLEGHGTQTLTQGLMNSCNPFFIDIGQKLGIETYYKYFDAFGFTEKTGLDISGEVNSIVHAQDKRGIVELASTSFGQSFKITPIQLLTATCAIANGGKLMTPYVVDSIVDDEQNVIEKFEPEVKREVISEKTADTVCQMMEAVVAGGTGKTAYIPGYRIAGKTATSEKLDPGSDEDAYIASFVAFAPANDPKIAILVGVDEPSGEYRSGGKIAGPVIEEVMGSVLKYLNVEPQYTQEELDKISKSVPDLVGKTVQEAQTIASAQGIELTISGEGETVKSQLPLAGALIPTDGIVVAQT